MLLAKQANVRLGPGGGRSTRRVAPRVFPCMVIATRLSSGQYPRTCGMKPRMSSGRETVSRSGEVMLQALAAAPWSNRRVFSYVERHACGGKDEPRGRRLFSDPG